MLYPSSTWSGEFYNQPHTKYCMWLMYRSWPHDLKLTTGENLCSSFFTKYCSVTRRLPVDDK